MLTMQVLRPKSHLDVCYCSDYPREITRPIPQELLPVACAVCGSQVEQWRVAMGLGHCGDCGKGLAKLRKPKRTIEKPSALLQMLGGWRSNKERAAADDGRAVWRKCRYAMRKVIARAGADTTSPVTRQTTHEAVSDCVTEYCRRLSTIEPGKTVNHWRVIWYAARDTIRKYVVSTDSVSFGALVAKPIVPRGFTPVSSYSHSWELLEPLRSELQAVLAKLGCDGEFDLLDTAAMVQSVAPELWSGIEHRVLSRIES